MVKKTCQAFKSLNSDVWASSLAKITIFGLDEQEINAKNRTSKNSAIKLTNHLEMVKKHIWLMSELGVRPKLKVDLN